MPLGHRLVVMAALATSAFLCAPARAQAADAGKPVVGGTLTVAAPGDPRSLDPVAAPGPLTDRYAEVLYEALFASDKDFVPRPMLVERYDVSGDKLTYTFHLRKGVRFHDGSALSAKDVVASLNRFLAVTAIGKQVARDVKSLQASGDSTVVLTLSRPRYPLLSELATTAADIFKADIVAGLPASGFSGEQAIGTGPYKLKSWKPGQEIVLEKFDGYASRSEENWGGFAGAKHAYLQTIAFPIVRDANAQVIGLKSGRWDFVEPNIDQYDVLKSDSKLVVHPLAGANLNVFVLNQSPGTLFANVKARQALSLLIDRKAIGAAMGANKDILENTPAYVIKAIKHMYSSAGEKDYAAHDPKKAKALFAEAGLKPGDTIQIMTISTFPWMQQMATVLQAELKAIGIESKISTYDWPTAAKLVQSPTGWDIQTVFYNAVSTSPAGLRVLSNPYKNRFETEKGNQLKAAYDAAQSDAEAAKALDAMQQYFWDEYANVTVNITHEFAAYTPRLKGYGHFYRVFWNSWLAK